MSSSSTTLPPLKKSPKIPTTVDALLKTPKKNTPMLPSLTRKEFVPSENRKTDVRPKTASRTGLRKGGKKSKKSKKLRKNNKSRKSRKSKRKHKRSRRS